MADEQPTSDPGRDKLASQVVQWSGVGIALVSVAIVAAAAYTKQDADKTLTTVFNTLIPLFGTWVGTVLAFYFSSKNYEAAAKATKDLVQQFGNDRLKQIMVKDAWIPVRAIAAVAVEKDQEDSIDFKEKVEALLSSNKVSRVPIWDKDKIVRYVIHESMIYQFLAKTDKPKPTLKDFLEFKVDARIMADIVSKIAWVAQTATLADAKAKMDATVDCQDVFVTNTGSKDESVLGWITNADVAKKASA